MKIIGVGTDEHGKAGLWLEVYPFRKTFLHVPETHLSGLLDYQEPDFLRKYIERRLKVVEEDIFERAAEVRRRMLEDLPCARGEIDGDDVLVRVVYLPPNGDAKPELCYRVEVILDKTGFLLAATSPTSFGLAKKEFDRIVAKHALEVIQEG